jgi:hypothetical protein
VAPQGVAYLTKSARLRECWRLLVRFAISSSVTAAVLGGCDHSGEEDVEGDV